MNSPTMFYYQHQSMCCELRIRPLINDDDEEEADEEEVNAGTEKPAAKGRRMYCSEKLTFVEMSSADGQMLFRGNCEASYHKECRYPAVAVGSNGKISSATCNCQAASDGRCCHVACLLFFVEDLALGMIHKLAKACTSKAQAWGKGSKRKLEPGPICSQR
jgi:hypothetical protein